MRACRFLSVAFIIFFLFSHIVLAQDVKSFDVAEKKKFPVSGFIGFSFNTMIAESHEYVCKYDGRSHLRFLIRFTAAYISLKVFTLKGIFRSYNRCQREL